MGGPRHHHQPAGPQLRHLRLVDTPQHGIRHLQGPGDMEVLHVQTLGRVRQGRVDQQLHRGAWCDHTVHRDADPGGLRKVLSDHLRPLRPLRHGGPPEVHLAGVRWGLGRMGGPARLLRRLRPDPGMDMVVPRLLRERLCRDEGGGHSGGFLHCAGIGHLRAVRHHVLGHVPHPAQRRRDAGRGKHLHHPMEDIGGPRAGHPQRVAPLLPRRGCVLVYSRLYR